MGQVYQLSAEWILPFQKWGLFSVGGHLGSFPLSAPQSNVPYPIYENGIGGLQFRYQLKLSKYPIVVPTASLVAEYYRIRPYQDSPAVQASGMNLGLGAGLMLNLGFIDAVTAREAYASLGLTKAYLTAEIQTLSISSSVLSLSGTFYLLGLRTEFE